MAENETTIIETDDERDERITRDYRTRGEKALAILNDPQRFAAEMREYTFGNDRLGFDGLFHSDIPAHFWAAKQDAFRLIRASIETPGIDPKRAIDTADDVANGLAFAFQDIGVMMGVALEQLRVSILATYEAAMHDDKYTLELDRATLATLRDEINSTRDALGRKAA